MSLGASDSPYFCSDCCGDIFPFHSLYNENFSLMWTDQRTDSYQHQAERLLLPANFVTGNDQYCSAEYFGKRYVNINKFVILHVNVRSLTKNFEKLEQLIMDINVFPDIIAVSETKLKRSMALPHLPGCNFVECDSETNAGGVGLFIKLNYSFNVVNSLKLEANHCEDVWVEVKLLNSDSSVVGAIYRHPHYDTSNVLD